MHQSQCHPVSLAWLLEHLVEFFLSSVVFSFCLFVCFVIFLCRYETEWSNHKCNIAQCHQCRIVWYRGPAELGLLWNTFAPEALFSKQRQTLYKPQSNGLTGEWYTQRCSLDIHITLKKISKKKGNMMRPCLLERHSVDRRQPDGGFSLGRNLIALMHRWTGRAQQQKDSKH